MRKTSIYFSIILISISTILLMTTVIFGWLVFNKNKSMAEFFNGEIIIETQVNGIYDLDELPLRDIAYVDFVQDVLWDSSGALNNMASVISVQIINGIYSTDVKNLIQLTETTGNGLLYMIVYEGKNIPSGSIGSPLDYHSLLQTIFAGESNPTNARALLTAHNETVIQTMATEKLEGNEWMSFQIVSWGDYDVLTNPLSYLFYTYEFDLSISTIQWEGVV
jgi:hypothetical protein